MIVTAQDMFQATLDFLDKHNTHSVTPEEWNLRINATQLDYIDLRYSEFQTTQKRIDELRVLHTRLDINNTGNNVSGEEVFILPADYLYNLSLAAKVEYLDNKCCLTGVSGLGKMRPMKADRKWEIIRDPFNKPKRSRIYYEMIGNDIYVLTGGEAIAQTVQLDYLRYPVNIDVLNNVDCELPLHVRRELVDLACKQILEQIESPRYQSMMNENNINLQ